MSEPLLFTVERPVRRAVEQLADQRQTSLAKVCRAALHEYLARQAPAVVAEGDEEEGGA